MKLKLMQMLLLLLLLQFVCLFLSCAITIPVDCNYSIHITYICVWMHRQCGVFSRYVLMISFSLSLCLSTSLFSECIVTLEFYHWKLFCAAMLQMLNITTSTATTTATCAYKPPTHKERRCSLSCTKHIYIHTYS